MKKTGIHFASIIAIIIFFLVTRFFGNGYDNYRHLHPDERWLIMVTEKIHFFDRLDPDFFAYGSLPIYALKAVAQLSDSFFATKFDNYDGLLVLGRRLASLTDITTGLIVFLLARKLSKRKELPYFAVIVYGLMFFPTQNSNFFIVDNFVNLFFSLTLLQLVNYWRKTNGNTLALLGLSYGLLLSSKITPIIILPAIVMAIVTKAWLEKPQTKGLLKRLFQKIPSVLLFLSIAIITTMIFMPFAYLKSEQFIREISAQIQMNSNAYVFPYTLQYVNTTPYLFYLKQIFFWGTGPIIALLACFGLFKVLQVTGNNMRQKKLQVVLAYPALPYILANLLFFLVIGASAVKFMRYMLPLYPSLAIAAGWGISELMTFQWRKLRWGRGLTFLLTIGAVTWYLGFLSIYSKDHSRARASEWMLTNIPAGSMLAGEHWDDRLPLYGGEIFEYLDLPLYEQPDDEKKWLDMNQRLSQADYIILASNRLYGFLPKLWECKPNKPRCYPKTTQYYSNLFAEKLGFTKVAEFYTRPNFLGLEINDDNADESFTVYDHPRVIIFKRNTSSY